MPFSGRPNPTDPGDAADLSTPQGYCYRSRILRSVLRTPVATPVGKALRGARITLYLTLARIIARRLLQHHVPRPSACGFGLLKACSLASVCLSFAKGHEGNG